MQVLISAEAQSEFRHAVKFYEKRQKGLGKKFSNAVKANRIFCKVIQKLLKSNIYKSE